MRFSIIGQQPFQYYINNNVLFNVSVFKRTCISMQDFLKKHDVAKTEDLVWLNQFGTIGTFLKMISNSSNETSVLKPP
jgi:hypothetical protein